MDIDLELIDELIKADEAENEASFNNIDDLLDWLNDDGR